MDQNKNRDRLFFLAATFAAGASAIGFTSLGPVNLLAAAVCLIALGLAA